jgi:hypothetical protein
MARPELAIDSRGLTMPDTEDILTRVSQNGRVRARVQRIASNNYRVDVERLIEAVDAGGCRRGEFWSVVTGLTSYTDSEERAALLAEENLRCCPPDAGD